MGTVNHDDPLGRVDEPMVTSSDLGLHKYIAGKLLHVVSPFLLLTSASAGGSLLEPSLTVKSELVGDGFFTLPPSWDIVRTDLTSRLALTVDDDFNKCYAGAPIPV
jgi:hypothetical protein